MKLRYGYVSRQPQKRLTPKSAFLRKLERMQRASVPVPVTVINEVYEAPDVLFREGLLVAPVLRPKLHLVPQS